MPFVMPDLIVESIVRDGFKNARNDNTVIDDVFGNLTRAFASKKYGQSEIEKIKELVNKKQISIVHAFHLVESNVPCISIQLMSEREDTQTAFMGDVIGQQQVAFSTPQQLASIVKVASFTPTAYDSKTGTVTVPDAVNLSQIYANLLFVDSAGTKHTITGGIDNTAGQKKFSIAKNSEVDLGAGAEIQTSITYEQYTARGSREKAQLLIGIHTGDALTTKYVYTLVKYFLLSRKDDIRARDMQLSTYDGSDFHRNMEYPADVVFTRFLNVTGELCNDWQSSKVQLIDSVEVKTLVPADEAGNAELGLTNQTVQTTKD